MWVGYRDRDNCLALRNPATLHDAVLPYTHLAKGHPEGWNDAQTATIFAFYDFIRRGKRVGEDETVFATFREGYEEMLLVEAILASSRARGWVKVDSGTDPE